MEEAPKRKEEHRKAGIVAVEAPKNCELTHTC